MINLTRRATATIAATALVASGLAATTFTPQAHAAIGECVAGSPTETVTIFAFNDFHGRIIDDSKSLTDPSAYLAGRLFTPVEQARAARGDDNVALISSGDNIGASTFVSMIADDAPTLDVLNAAGLEASTVGNHEFDKGWNDLAGRVVPAAQGFEYLGANVYTKGTTTVAAPMEEYTVLEKAGIRIAVVGAVTSDLPSLVSPAGIADLTIGNPVEAINRVTDDLLDGDEANGEADVVLASLHEGAALATQSAATNADNSAAFDEIYRDIDPRVAAIFNGHTHQRYTFDSADGRPIVQAGSYAERLGKLDLVVDTSGKGVCSATDSLVTPPGTSDETLPAIQAINDIARAAYGVAMVHGAEVVGETSAAISTAGTGNADTRNTESPMSNLVAEMFHEVLGGGDAEFIGIQNPGGTRDSFDAGDVTLREAALTLPFANSLFTTQVTGAQFTKVLEQQWQRNAAGSVPSRPFLQLGLSKNVTYTYDESLPEGSRITSVSINGAPIDPAGLYTVGGGSFLITGGDNFHELGKGVNTRDTGKTDLASWTTWIGEQGVLSPDYSKRGVSAKLAAGPLVAGPTPLTFTFGQPLADGVAPQTLDMFLLGGDKVSPQLANTSITAFIGDVQVGSAPVTDGVATVEVSLKKGSRFPITTGAYTLRFEVAESGTQIYVPIDVESKRPEKKPHPLGK
ncbi:bifunctional metallophosphatase/5'-nucleotidase [Tessaracoccus sp. Z1128]